MYYQQQSFITFFVSFQLFFCTTFLCQFDNAKEIVSPPYEKHNEACFLSEPLNQSHLVHYEYFRSQIGILCLLT